MSEDQLINEIRSRLGNSAEIQRYRDSIRHEVSTAEWNMAMLKTVRGD